MIIKNKKPLISVIVNCFNGEKYLKECINSIIKQTYKNWEVIFWDNLSKDKSKDIKIKGYLLYLFGSIKRLVTFLLPGIK